MLLFALICILEHIFGANTDINVEYINAIEQQKQKHLNELQISKHTMLSFLQNNKHFSQSDLMKKTKNIKDNSENEKLKKEKTFIHGSFEEKNSSIELKAISLYQSNRNSLFLVDSLSSAKIEDCQIFIEKSQGKWIVENFGGRTVFSNVSLVPEKLKAFVHCIQHDRRPKNCFEGFSSLELNFCHFSSFCVEGTQPFVGSSDSQRVFVSGCAFENVSHSNVKQNVCPQSMKRNMPGGECLVTNSQFSFVDNAYYGSIFEGLTMRSGMFGEFNSSFEKSTKTEINRYVKRSGNTKIEDCIFTDLRGDFGGAVDHVSSGSATITRSDFVRCWSSKGDGAMRLWSGAQNVTNCSFTFCWSNGNTGGATFLYASPGKYIGVNFSSCWDVHGGNCAHFRNSQSPLFESCCFVNGTTTGYASGGALLCFGSAVSTITNCLFKNNTRIQTKGGGFFCAICENNYASKFSLSYSLFDNNSATEGHDFYASSQYASVINSDCFVGCRSLSSNLTSRRVVIEGGSASDDWIPLFVGKVHANSGNGTDEWICGTADRPCKTLNHSLWMSDVRREMQEFVLGEGVYGDTELAVDAMGMKFEGCGASSTSMEPRAEGGAGMKITSGKLIVEKICLVHNSGLWKGSHLLKIEGRAGVAELRDAVLRRERSAEGDEQAEVFEKSVIEISDGELICNNVSMKWMKSKQELVRIGIAGTARIEASTFLEIERSEGDGSVFCGVVEDGKELELNGVSFEYCRCLRGSGGALWLEMKMGSRVGIGNTTNSDEKTMFESCSAGGSETRENGGRGYGGGVYLYVCEGMRDFVVKNAGFLNCEARAGKNMFVLAPKLNDCVTVDSFMFDVVNWSNDRNGFVGSDCVFTETNLLRFVILFKGRTVHVAEDGFDVMRCGSVEDPCMSLWQGLMHVEDCEEERMIEIMKKAMIDDRLDVSGIKIEAHEGTLIERDAKATIVVEVKQRMEGVGLVNSKKAGFEGIRFEVEIVEECLNTTIIANNKGVLSLTRCALSIKENEFVGEIVFVHLIKGELKGKGIEMESESVCNGMFVVESGCRCIAEELKVEGCKVKSGALICVRVGMEAGERKGNIDDQEAGIGIANSSIGWVDGEGSDAVVVKSEGEVSVGAEVNGTKVEGCKCGRSTKGGGVCWQMSAGGWLRVSECSVVQCGCSGISGRGGGVYVGAEVDGVLDFVFEGDKFEGNTAYIGRHIFVACHNISSQINETQFVMDLRGISGQAHMISGSDTTDHREDTDLMPFITIYQSSTIFVSSGGAKGGENNRQCGKEDKCCETLGYGLTHIVHEYGTRVVVDEASEVETEIKLENLTLLAKGSRATVGMSRLERKEKGCVVECKGNVSVERISFEIPEVFPTEHEQIFCVEEGTLSMSECWVKPAEGCNVCRMSTLMHGERSSVTITGLIVSQFACVSLVECVECEVKLSEVAVEQGESRNGLFFLRNGEMNVKELDVVDVRIENGPAVNMLREGGNENNGMLPDEKRRKQLRGDEKRMDVMLSKFSNISRTSEGACGVECEGGEGEIVLQNCSFAGCESRSTRGIEASFDKCTSLSLDSCMFVGAIEGNEQTKEKEGFEREEICRWNGSVVDVEESVVSMKDVSVSNSSLGGLTVKGGSVQIYAGYFWNNGPRFAGYSSLRRNVMCSGDGEMNVMSLKGGDGAKDNSSMWIQSDECKMWGIVDERPSVFFIPILEGVEAEEKDGKIVFLFKGALLIPCNLSFEVISNAAGVDSIVKCEFLEEGFVDENETIGLVGVHEIGWGMEEAEISVGITFGDLLKSHSTSHVIVKNKTELQQNADVNIVKGGEKEKTLWPIIVIVLVVTLLIVLIVSIILAVRWRKAKNEAEDLRVIVNDTVKKDLKLIEMVTMEMSPEEQWKRAEREAEKSNEERIKKRVYEKSLGHSESSEHLLSESGSTEYILGRDSDRIPDWALEKVEEDEETRKRTPSPSISSTSTTDTDTTFIRPESMCPTTSSMSNLVDAMACSSPHEKLIVDLRDSLFMLLHGRNEKKEMAIGSLKEREQTAAQILFWVANLALHSFDEMENKLQSLSSLSPHIVLFSEHMVICIVMHSDFLSDDDSDSSSISSSTVVTSDSGGDDDDDSLPSSAFEDEDDFRKECLRWKAPELQINMKMGATKESVAFSIGMMLWECLTLQIPFGEYPAEVAGQKIANGERPSEKSMEESGLGELVKSCWQSQHSFRISVDDLKRELFMHFPAGAMILTMSDAIDDEDVTEEEIFKTSDEVRLISESQETFSGNSSKKGKEKRKQLDQKKKEKTRETEKVQMKIIT